MSQRTKRTSQPDPLAESIRLPLRNDDAYNLVAATVSGYLSSELEETLKQLSASTGMTPGDRALLYQAMLSIRRQCMQPLANAGKRNSLLRADATAEQDEREGTVDDPVLPILREILKEHDGPLSIAWLLRHFNIPYGRGGRLERILQAERNAKAPMK